MILVSASLSFSPFMSPGLSVLLASLGSLAGGALSAGLVGDWSRTGAWSGGGVVGSLLGVVGELPGGLAGGASAGTALASPGTASAAMMASARSFMTGPLGLLNPQGGLQVGDLFAAQ